MRWKVTHKGRDYHRDLIHESLGKEIDWPLGELGRGDGYPRYYYEQAKDRIESNICKCVQAGEPLSKDRVEMSELFTFL